LINYSSLPDTDRHRHTHRTDSSTWTTRVVGNEATYLRPTWR